MERKEKPERYSIKNLEEGLRKKYPGLSVDKSLLILVGTMSYTHPSKDKEEIVEAMARKYL